jgi:hypothetical protein
MTDIERLVASLEPEEAAGRLVAALRPLLAHLHEDRRLALISGLAGETGDDKLSSLVHL